MDLSPPLPARSAPARVHPFGVPVAFEGCAGFLHPAAGTTAVVMVGSWGYEAFCLTRSTRLLAEAIAAAGYPVLRYDHPGSGDSLDHGDLGLDHWRAAFAAAVRTALVLTDAERVVVAAQGIGAAVALDGLAGDGRIAGFAALAPALYGRAWLRELQAWGAMVGGTVEGVPSIAGLALPPRLAAEIGRLDLRSAGAAIPGFVAARPGRSTEEALADRLGVAGRGAARHVYDDLEAAVTDPTRAVPPAGTHRALVDWLVATVPPAPGPDRVRETSAAGLAGAGFVETGVRFGPGSRLFGVLCRPAAGGADTGVVFVNAGRDPHTGWARSTVEHARRLAVEGVASLRIALSGTGESAAAPEDADRELLYSAVHQADVRAAVERLAAEGCGRIVATGRCSGAFAALHAAPDCPRIDALVLVNMLRVVWDPRETVAAAIAEDVRPLGAVALKALDPAVLVGILTGRVPVANVLRRAAAMAKRRFPLLDRHEARLRRQARTLIRSLSERGTRVSFVSGTEDAGLERIHAVFGPAARGMTAYPGVTLDLVADTDHNLNPAPAREEVYRLLSAVAKAR